MSRAINRLRRCFRLPGRWRRGLLLALAGGALPLWGGGFVLLDGVSIPATLELSDNALR